MSPTTKTQQLAAVRSAGRRTAEVAPIAKVVAAAVAAPKPEPTFEPFTQAMDPHRVHMGVARRMNLDYTLGSAFTLIGEARSQTGAQRLASVNKAISYLQDEAEFLGNTVSA